MFFQNCICQTLPSWLPITSQKSSTILLRQHRAEPVHPQLRSYFTNITPVIRRKQNCWKCTQGRFSAHSFCVTERSRIRLFPKQEDYTHRGVRYRHHSRSTISGLQPLPTSPFPPQSAPNLSVSEHFTVCGVLCTCVIGHAQCTDPIQSPHASRFRSALSGCTFYPGCTGM